MTDKEVQFNGYRAWIETIKSKIKSAQSKVALTVNVQLIELYWELGKEINHKLVAADWGSNVMEQIAIDLKHEFPNLKGFSRRNLYAINQFYRFYQKQFEFVPQAVAQIPWGHNRLIVSKSGSIEKALFYCNELLKHGWSRDVLDSQINSQLYERKPISTHNFKETLTDNQLKIVSQTLKDPYNFDFLGLQNETLEREVENALMNHITDFLLELGKGFAFVGRQYKVEVAETDYFIDLLFYHLDLRCYIVIELKIGKFIPEYAGKLNFYLSAVDSQIKKENDNKTIGILLCKKKNKIEAEYALRDINKPIGISEYRLSEAIPDNLKTNLPSIEELEIDLNKKIESRLRK